MNTLLAIAVTVSMALFHPVLIDGKTIKACKFTQVASADGSRKRHSLTELDSGIIATLLDRYHLALPGEDLCGGCPPAVRYGLWTEGEGEIIDLLVDGTLVVGARAYVTDNRTAATLLRYLKVVCQESPEQ